MRVNGLPAIATDVLPCSRGPGHQRGLSIDTVINRSKSPTVIAQSYTTPLGERPVGLGSERGYETRQLYAHSVSFTPIRPSGVGGGGGRFPRNA